MLTNNFVQVLDQEQQRRNTRYMDIMHAYYDYQITIMLTNNLGDTSYVGMNTHISPYSIKIPMIDNSVAQYSPVDTPKTAKRIEIDAKINNFEDLIAIVNKYEYCEDTEYNIDLKALTKIKPELLELHSMIGLSEFKNSILNQLLYFVQHLHIGTNPDFLHTALTGPPGTGKTEIAMIMGRMYSKIGILKEYSI